MFYVKELNDRSSWIQTGLNILKYWFDVNFMTLRNKTKYVRLSYTRTFDEQLDTHYKFLMIVPAAVLRFLIIVVPVSKYTIL